MLKQHLIKVVPKRISCKLYVTRSSFKRETCCISVYKPTPSLLHFHLPTNSSIQTLNLSIPTNKLLIQHNRTLKSQALRTHSFLYTPIFQPNTTVMTTKIWSARQQKKERKCSKRDLSLKRLMFQRLHENGYCYNKAENLQEAAKESLKQT